jgi:DNA-binding transcriptional ArsR family regulator
MDDLEAVKALAALAQVHRLRIFRALVVAGPQGLTPGALAESLALPAATLSFHLKELATAGLVTQERASRNLIYRAAYEQMNALLGYLTQNCCQGQPCTTPAVAAGIQGCDCRHMNFEFFL